MRIPLGAAPAGQPMPQLPTRCCSSACSSAASLQQFLFERRANLVAWAIAASCWSESRAGAPPRPPVGGGPFLRVLARCLCPRQSFLESTAVWRLAQRAAVSSLLLTRRRCVRQRRRVRRRRGTRLLARHGRPRELLLECGARPQTASARVAATSASRRPRRSAAAADSASRSRRNSWSAAVASRN